MRRLKRNRMVTNLNLQSCRKKFGLDNKKRKKNREKEKGLE